jgi:hypothetical protein
MQEIYFLARHAPFWGVPLLILGLEFGYLFWLKKKKRSAMLGVLVALIGFSATVFYVWAGGPEKSVKVIKNLQKDLK